MESVFWQEFEWILPFCRNLQRKTSIQGMFYTFNEYLRTRKWWILFFSGIETLTVVQKFIFFTITIDTNGVCQVVPVSKPKMIQAGWYYIHQVRNQIKIRLQFISKFTLSLIKMKYLRTGYSKNFWSMGRKRWNEF